MPEDPGVPQTPGQGLAEHRGGWEPVFSVLRDTLVSFILSHPSHEHCPSTCSLWGRLWTWGPQAPQGWGLRLEIGTTLKPTPPPHTHTQGRDREWGMFSSQKTEWPQRKSVTCQHLGVCMKRLPLWYSKAQSMSALPLHVHTHTHTHTHIFHSASWWLPIKC